MYSNQQPTMGQPVPPEWAPAPESPGPRDRRGGRLREFLLFRRLVTPGLVVVLWVLGSILIVIGLIVGGYDALASDEFAAYSTGEVALYVIGLVLGGLLLILSYRVILEIVVVLFRIHDRLVTIDQRGRGL